MYMNLSNFLGLKNPRLNFVNFLSSRVLLSYKPFSYKKRVSTYYLLRKNNPFLYYWNHLKLLLILSRKRRLRWELPSNSEIFHKIFCLFKSDWKSNARSNKNVRLNFTFKFHRLYKMMHYNL